MEHLNRVELRGQVGSVRTQVTGGILMCRFTVATSRAYKDKEGTAVIETTWHNIVAWENDKLTDLSKIEKGSKVYVSGRLHTQKYMGPDDVEKQMIEVVANRVAVLDIPESLQYEF